MDLLKLLGVPEASVRGHADLEKLRQKSKDLYKRYVKEKRESDAKKVMQAFELFTQKFKKRDASSGTHKASASATSGSRRPEQPSAHGSRPIATAGRNSRARIVAQRQLGGGRSRARAQVAASWSTACQHAGQSPARLLGGRRTVPHRFFESLSSNTAALASSSWIS